MHSICTVVHGTTFPCGMLRCAAKIRRAVCCWKVTGRVEEHVCIAVPTLLRASVTQKPPDPQCAPIDAP